jgi:leader peptidase (prepilin peptidase)/N-methyltransferase
MKPSLLAVTPGLRWLAARYSVPTGEPVRTACDECGGPLPRTAHCGVCGTRFGAPPYVLEVVTAAGAVAAARAAPIWPAALWWVACAVPLLFIDLRVRRLPDPLTGAALAGVLLLETVAAATAGQWAALGRAVLCALVFGAGLLVPAVLLGPRGLGLGDVKLFVSIAALFGWWGWGAVAEVLFLAVLGSGLVAAGLLITGRATRGTDLAMGPYLVGASLVMLALSP